MINNADLPPVPADIRNSLVLQTPPGSARTLRVCIPATENSNPAVQSFLARLLALPDRDVHLDVMDPPVFRQLQQEDTAEDITARDPRLQPPGRTSRALPGKVKASEVQLRVINMFREAHRVRASDIHFTVRQTDTLIEMRINGLLYPVATLSREEGLSWLRTIYQSMCDLSDNMFKDYMPQDGRLKQEHLKDARLFGARYAHINTPKGVFAVMRLIPDDGSAPPTPEALGFLPEQIRLIQVMLNCPEGIILNSGPTGSGKSTSCRSFIHYWIKVNGRQRRIITQEDPVEGEVDDAIHTSVTGDRSSEEDIELAWLRGRRALLRLDPDAVVIGEIRDGDSAMAAINFSESGHLVLSTQHANSPLGNLNRLQIIGVPQGFLRSSRLFLGLIAQRLLPTLCPECALTLSGATLTDEETAFIQETFSPEEQDALRFRNPDGCQTCIQWVMGTPASHGLKGRTVVAEVMRTTPAILHTYHEEGEDAARARWLGEGGISLSRHALIRVREGRADPLMANAIVPFDDPLDTQRGGAHGQ